ncbi:chemotaxis protein CheW [Pseudomonas neuropathica]
MNSLIDTGNLMFWLLAVSALGIVILVVLSTRYRGDPRTDIQISAPLESLAEVEPDSLERFNRYAIEQLSAVSEILAIKHLNKPDDRGEDSDSKRHERRLIIDEQLDISFGNELNELEGKVCQLNRLAAQLLDIERALVGTGVGTSPAAETAAPNSHYLFFTLGGVPFAVSASSVDTIVEVAPIVVGSGLSTRLRRAIRLRDALVPVIDLGAHFGGPPIEIGPSTSIVIFEVIRDDSKQLVGVLVDAVVKVLPIPLLDTQSPTTSDNRISSDFILGTVTIDNQGVTLLDIGRGFSANELVAFGSRNPTE